MPIWQHSQDFKFQISRGKATGWPLRSPVSVCKMSYCVFHRSNQHCFLPSRRDWTCLTKYCFYPEEQAQLRDHSPSHLLPSTQSSVMSVCFARFHPNLVVGGTYSGQIVLWDNRSHRRTPVQRTPLSAAAHTVSQASTILLWPTQIPKKHLIGQQWLN